MKTELKELELHHRYLVEDKTTEQIEFKVPEIEVIEIQDIENGDKAMKLQFCQNSRKGLTMWVLMKEFNKNFTVIKDFGVGRKWVEKESYVYRTDQ